MYTELIIGGEIYKLRLTTKTSIQLEKNLGCNPLNLLMDIDNGKMPTMANMICILQGMLLALHHGYTLDKTIDLFDKYVEDGNTMFDLIPVFIEVLQNSGYMSKEDEVTGEEATEKN